MLKRLRNYFLCLAILFSCVTLTGCNWEKWFILSNGSAEVEDAIEGVEYFNKCENAIFFALYNYYGYEGQHFTNKWLGMMDALNEHGITVDGWSGVKDAKTFTITRGPNCDLPEDAKIYMVDNQDWDPGIQFNRPFAKMKPMVVISTCNGVEFASDPISASGMGISNATMAGFSKTYREAMEAGTLHYIAAKYAAHILPIVAACVDAVDNGSTLRNADGTALSLSVENWNIQSIAQYNEMEEVDSVDPDHPALRWCNISKFFDKANPEYGADNLDKFMLNSSKAALKELYELNGTNASEDVARTGRKLKCGILAPGSVNDQVAKYIQYLKNYCGKIFNLEFVQFDVTSKDTQDIGAETLCNQGVDFILSLQDDTNRVKSITVANKNKVYYGIIGTTQNPIDYEECKNLPYYVGSIGTSIEEERRSAYEMTNYYLNCMIKRAESMQALIEYQAQVKGIDLTKKEGE